MLKGLGQIWFRFFCKSPAEGIIGQRALPLPLNQFFRLALETCPIWLGCFRHGLDVIFEQGVRRGDCLGGFLAFPDRFLAFPSIDKASYGFGKLVRRGSCCLSTLLSRRVFGSPISRSGGSFSFTRGCSWITFGGGRILSSGGSALPTGRCRSIGTSICRGLLGSLVAGCGSIIFLRVAGERNGENHDDNEPDK